MESETTKQHQDESSNNITCGIITLSDLDACSIEK